jgi:hypothetical protein
MMSSVRSQALRSAAALGIFLLGVGATYVSLALLVLLVRFMDVPGSDLRIVTIEITKLALSVAGGVALARFASGRLSRGRFSQARPTPAESHAAYLRLSRWALGALGVAYFVTWAFGVPTVQSDLENQAVRTYKELEARDHDRDWQNFPRIRTFFALPVFPALILTYHEYQVAWLHGWGGWQLHVWYPGHIRRIGSKMAWIS